ncbi:MAG: DUF1206 domain-containing protein [Sporichthyaceae bacterium]
MATGISTAAGDKAQQIGDSAPLSALARVGLVAYGVVHLLIGWVALTIAWGSSGGKNADSSGALKTVAAQPFGKALLVLVAAGLLALALWQASESCWGYRDREGARRTRKRVSSAGKAAFYAALGVSAAKLALGAGSASPASQQRTTSGILAWPAGQVLVVLAGLVIVGIGVAGVVKGARGSFREEIGAAQISGRARQAVTRLGQVGYIAKGVAVVLVGGLLAYAALDFDPTKARGLDGALQAILTQPWGRFLLSAVALGFVAFGLFAIVQSRYRRM